MKSRSSEFEIHFFENLVKKRPDYIEALMPLAEAYTRMGRYQDGLKIDRRLARLCQSDPIVRYNLACSLALVGKKQEAIQALKRSIQLGYRDFKHISRDKDLECLHRLSSFKKILAQ